MKGIIDEEKEIFFATKPNLFKIGTITLSKPNNFTHVVFRVEASTRTPRDRSKLILPQHASKSKIWILHVGIYLRITR